MCAQRRNGCPKSDTAHVGFIRNYLLVYNFAFNMEEDQIKKAAKAAKLMHYSEKLSKAIQTSVKLSRMEENTDEENALFFETIKSHAPTVIRGTFLEATIISVHSNESFFVQKVCQRKIFVAILHCI